MGYRSLSCGRPAAEQRYILAMLRVFAQLPPERREAVRALIACLAETMRVALGREHYDMYKPTALIIPSNLRESHLGRDDNSCALENIFLAAHSYGVGSVWINQLGAVCDDEKVRAMLDEFGIPSDHVVYGIAALGYAAPDAPYKDRTYAGEVRYIE